MRPPRADAAPARGAARSVHAPWQRRGHGRLRAKPRALRSIADAAGERAASAAPDAASASACARQHLAEARAEQHHGQRHGRLSRRVGIGDRARFQSEPGGARDKGAEQAPPTRDVGMMPRSGERRQARAASQIAGATTARNSVAPKLDSTLATKAPRISASRTSCGCRRTAWRWPRRCPAR